MGVMPLFPTDQTSIKRQKITAKYIISNEITTFFYVVNRLKQETNENGTCLAHVHIALPLKQHTNCRVHSKPTRRSFPT